MPLDNLTQTSSDWRQSLRSNNRKTFFVIMMFFLIYLGLGLLVDTALYAERYPQVPTESLFYAVMTLQLFPLATLIMLAVAGISLFVTLLWHDQLMLLGTEYHEVTPETARDVSEKQLYNIIEELKIAAGLRYMPKVYIINADYMNAFASGYSEKSAMVAITHGLMQKLNRDELQAVMAHEISHIRHLDIKLTLMASMLANLMLIVIDVLFYHAIYSNRSEERSRNSLMSIVLILRYLLPVINMLLLLYLSRTREYMADAGCVALLRNNQPLASALLKIHNDHEANQVHYTQEYHQTPHENVRREAYIFDPAQAGISGLSSLSDMFSTHPNLKDRLAALGFKYDK